MTGTCDTFKMFSFSVMQSTFRLCNLEILAVPKNLPYTQLLTLAGTVDRIFVGKKELTP